MTGSAELEQASNHGSRSDGIASLPHSNHGLSRSRRYWSKMVSPNAYLEGRIEQFRQRIKRGQTAPTLLHGFKKEHQHHQMQKKSMNAPSPQPLKVVLSETARTKAASTSVASCTFESLDTLGPRGPPSVSPSSHAAATVVARSDQAEGSLEREKSS